jgi:parallel beta-helix repeat protein
MKKKLTILATLALVAGLMVPPGIAWGLTCGDTVTADTTLDSDLASCIGTALIIGADGITLDLNSYTLSGNSTGYGVDNTGGYDGVIIKNGTIDSFGQGIKANVVSNFTLEDLNFSGDTGGGHAHVIDIRNSADVVIKDVTIAVGAGSPDWAEAIRLQSIDGVEVANVDVDGGWIGVNFAFDTVGDPPTNGIVKDSTFTGNSFIGVFIANSTSAMVKGNTITDTGWLAGIYAGSFGSGQVVTGVVIEDNEVSGGTGYGIALAGVDNSVVSRNRVLDDFGWGGIALEMASPQKKLATASTTIP